MNHPIMSVPRLGGGQASPPTAPTVTPCLQTRWQRAHKHKLPLWHFQLDVQLEPEKNLSLDPYPEDCGFTFWCPSGALATLWGQQKVLEEARGMGAEA